MATLSSVLAWRIPWTEGPGGLHSTGLQRIGHNLVTDLSLSLSHTHTHTCFIWDYRQEGLPAKIVHFLVWGWVEADRA